ncbi:hypothetical protein [Mucilaginibacter agri]|uniref:Uncharacterized protein n=1 Tax=Mucilaginibacter agri TaxID=2695265 RepID=A0A965ZE38_9SPHI|nr:hypothetical protein [Mucilaginibacter agri]NCD68087.1 hypothetical protein [Mucilaginibacter agri]
MQEIKPVERKRSKDSNELLRTFSAFFKEPSTMRMVEVQTGILRPNICRYVARLQKSGKIKLIKFGHCPYTKHIAGFYSTNPAFEGKAQIGLQYGLF